MLQMRFPLGRSGVEFLTDTRTGLSRRVGSADPSFFKPHLLREPTHAQFAVKRYLCLLDECKSSVRSTPADFDLPKAQVLLCRA